MTMELIIEASEHVRDAWEGILQVVPLPHSAVLGERTLRSCRQKTEKIRGELRHINLWSLSQ